MNGETRCGFCKALSSADQRFCSECGAPLTPSAPTEPLPPEASTLPNGLPALSETLRGASSPPPTLDDQDSVPTLRTSQTEIASRTAASRVEVVSESAVSTLRDPMPAIRPERAPSPALTTAKEAPQETLKETTKRSKPVPKGDGVPATKLVQKKPDPPAPVAEKPSPPKAEPKPEKKPTPVPSGEEPPSVLLSPSLQNFMAPIEEPPSVLVSPSLQNFARAAGQAEAPNEAPSTIKPVAPARPLPQFLTDGAAVPKVSSSSPPEPSDGIATLSDSLQKQVQDASENARKGRGPGLSALPTLSPDVRLLPQSALFEPSPSLVTGRFAARFRETPLRQHLAPGFSPLLRLRGGSAFWIAAVALVGLAPTFWGGDVALWLNWLWPALATGAVFWLGLAEEDQPAWAGPLWLGLGVLLARFALALVGVLDFLSVGPALLLGIGALWASWKTRGGLRFPVDGVLYGALLGLGLVAGVGLWGQVSPNPQLFPLLLSHALGAGLAGYYLGIARNTSEASAARVALLLAGASLGAGVLVFAVLPASLAGLVILAGYLHLFACVSHQKRLERG